MNVGNLYVATIDVLMRILIRFDLSSLPSASTITSATLTLSDSGFSEFSGTKTWTAYRLTRTNWGHTTATWNKYDGTNNWTTAGGDYTATNSDTCDLSGTGNLVFDGLAAMAQAALTAGLTQLDIIVIGPETSGSNQYHQCESGHYAGSTVRPSLTLGYVTTPDSGWTVSRGRPHWYAPNRRAHWEATR